MDSGVFEKARQARDPRFDGRFFVGVRTTGIYCRPVCPVRMPRSENVSFFESAAAAADAGFRPCLRCRPEAAPGTPAWNGTSTTVTRALRLIAEGALDSGGIEALSMRLGISERHLSRLFMRHVGTTPGSVARTRRLHFAKSLIDQTELSMTEIAMASGYGSLRRFNDHFHQVYGRSPGNLRKTSEVPTRDNLEFSLSFREPYHFDAILGFLALRAIPGVEWVENQHYVRTVQVNGSPAILWVRRSENSQELCCGLSVSPSSSLIGVVEKVRRLFDLNAIPQEINGVLSQDPAMKPIVDQNPGLRVPGAWDPFELSVRAIIGQQVSVKGASTVLGQMVQSLGSPFERGFLFPAPEVVAEVDPAGLPMPGTRAQAIVSLAEGVAEGRICYDAAPDELQDQLQSVRGIGPWTAQYIAMRACNDPDAFPVADLVLLRTASRLFGDVRGVSSLENRTLRWRPWRAYACMHLWNHSKEIS